MAKDPAILFYTSDFLTGTQFFTDTQCGQYIRLLCSQHQNGHIPEHHMKKICKTYDNPVFDKFEKDDEGKYFNQRMKNEIDKRKKYSESRSNNRKKKNDSETYDSSCDEHMENENTTTLYNCNKEELVNKLNAKNPSFEIVSESLSGQSWQEQVCMQFHWDVSKFSEFVKEWLAKKKLAGSFDYPVKALRIFVINDYQKVAKELNKQNISSKITIFHQ